MITEIFEFYYTTNMYPERLKPLSKHELCRGMSEESAETYLSLVEQLYNACTVDLNEKFVPKDPEVLRQHAIECDRIYTALIKHLFNSKARSLISEPHLPFDGVQKNLPSLLYHIPIAV